MELMSGYKHSDVGVIPFDWEVCTLGKLTTLIASGRSAIGKEYGDYPVHGSTGIVGYTMTPDYEGDVILAARVGANAGLINYVDGKYGVTDNTIIIRMNKDCCLPFFFRQLKAMRLNNLVFGSGQPLITGTQLKALSLVVPSRSEQQTIAQALSDVDALLATLDQMIAKKRDIKQATMQQLLSGETRLPGFSDEWQVKQLGDIGHFLKGSGVKKDEAQSGTLPCIRYGEIYTHHNDYIKSFNSWISPQVAATATRLKQGDLLFAGSGETKGEIGKCVAFIDDCEAYAGGDTVILRSSDINPMFMGYYCNTVSIVTQKASRGQGDAVVHISAAALCSIVLNLPSLSEQTAIATVLGDMDAELSALEARRDKTRNIKQAMMQELLTGKTRLIPKE